MERLAGTAIVQLEQALEPVLLGLAVLTHQDRRRSDARTVASVSNMIAVEASS
jgi:hypothetical protein